VRFGVGILSREDTAHIFHHGKKTMDSITSLLYHVCRLNAAQIFGFLKLCFVPTTNPLGQI
jgi:hypothetical protein